MAAIGLCVGATACSVALASAGRFEVVANDQGERTTPAVVCYTDDEVLTGEAAAAARPVHPTTTFSGLTKLLTQSTPLHAGEGRDVPVEDALAELFRRMLALAEDFSGQSVARCTLGVPARFSEEEKAALLRAAAAAGVNVTKLILEPVAAAIAHGLDEMEGEHTVAVVDVGGGSFDVTLLKSRSGLLEVLASASHASASGEDFNERLHQHFAQEFSKRHGLSLYDSGRAAAKLHAQVEKAKRALSKGQQASVSVDSLMDGHDFSSRITRARFEDMGHDLFRAVSEPIKEALAAAGVGKEEVSHILLVGGCANMPRVAAFVQKQLPRAQMGTGSEVEPDEAVAMGAAIDASLTGEVPEDTGVPVTPLPLWLRAADGDLTLALAAGSTLPASGGVALVPSAPGQEQLSLELYEGLRPVPSPEALLGVLVAPVGSGARAVVAVAEDGAVTLSLGSAQLVVPAGEARYDAQAAAAANAAADAVVVERADQARELRETEDEDAIEWLDSAEGRAATKEEIAEWLASDSEEDDSPVFVAPPQVPVDMD